MTTINTSVERAGRNDGQRGFTLLELIVSIGFMSMLAGLITGSSFLTIRTGAETGAVADIAVQTARTTRWLVRDVHRAETTNIVHLAPAVNSATFNWVDGGPVSCTIALSGTTMTRTCGGVATNIGNYISNLTFQRNGQLVTVTFLISPPKTQSKTEQINLNIALGGG